MSRDSLQTSFWLMVLVQTIGSVDMPGRGERKMPAPRQYVAIFVAWLILQFTAGINDNAERASAAAGWLLVITGMVVGPFGKVAVDFLSNTAKAFPAPDITQATASPPPIGANP